MIRASVLYPYVPGGRFDFGYYLDTHVPRARTILASAGLIRIEVDRGVSGEERGTPPRFTCVAHLYFDTAEHFYEAMDLHGDALALDVKRFTDLDLEIQVSEIVG